MPIVFGGSKSPDRMDIVHLALKPTASRLRQLFIVSAACVLLVFSNPGAAQAAGCKMSVLASFLPGPTPVAFKGSKVEFDIDLVASVESESGHWLRQLRPVGKKLVRKSSKAWQWEFTFDLATQQKSAKGGDMCNAALYAQLSARCGVKAVVNGRRIGAGTQSASVYVPGRRQLTQKREFKAVMCR